MRASNPGKLNVLLTIAATDRRLRQPYAYAMIAVLALGCWALIIAGLAVL